MEYPSLYHWTEKRECTAYFPDFHLRAEPALCPTLQPQLCCLPIAANSPRTLRLVRDVQQQGGDGAYTLEIGEQEITASAAGERGLFYALAAVKILLALGEGTLPQGVIAEQTDYPCRGIMLDVSRGKMATMSYLKQLVSFLADMRYNVLQLYCEDKLALEGHPLLGALTGAYTQTQIRELDQFCAAHFVELQPCIQTYSHMHGLLRCPGYSHLAENDDLFSFAAGKEEVYAFLNEEFAQVLPWFSSKTLNINMDEAYDIGTGFSAQAVEEQGRGQVFLRHIQRVIQAARRNGAETIQLWGDIVQKYPQLIGQLPENTVIIDWNYNPLEKFDSLAVFQQLGVPFWAAGGIGTWNGIFPRVYNAYINLSNLSAQAKESGAGGFLVTDWGDYGHMQPLGLSLYGYLLGAVQAASAQHRTGAQLEAAIWPLIFADEDQRAGFRALMESNLAENLKTDFKTMSIYYFFDDMLAGLSMRGNSSYKALTEDTFRQLLRCGEAACSALERTAAAGSLTRRRYPDEHWRELFGESYLQELRLSARMTRFIGEKGLLAGEIRRGLAREDLVPDDLMAMIFHVHQLYDEFCAIRRMFEEVWLLRAEHKGIQTSLSLFDHAGVQLAQTVRWLARQREALLRGEKVDSTLESYDGSAYEVLWTADFRNMWDRAYPWR